MVIGVLQMRIRLPESESLKEKRRVIKSITSRIRNKFNVSVSEVDCNDSWQLCTLGVVHVGSSRPYGDEVLNHVINLARAVKQIEVIDVTLEFL